MKVSNHLHMFQNLTSMISYSAAEQAILNEMSPFQVGDWDKSLTGTGRRRGIQKQRDLIKKDIKTKLLDIQFPHCIYCGFHEDIVGGLQRDHIAPKESYENFMFEPENLVLACANCNGFLKKNNFDTISSYNNVYKHCKFKIIHPYRDDYKDHLQPFRDNFNGLIIKAKKYSRKGRQTIKLFGLDNINHTNLRGAALMRENLKLTPAQEKILDLIIEKRY